MSDNKDNLYPETTFSVDDILKEVRAMKQGLSLDATKPAPEPERVEPSVPLKRITPESERVEPSVPVERVPVTPKSEEVHTPAAEQNAPVADGEDKLKRFFSKTKSSDFVEDADTAKSQIDALFGDDPNAVVRPFEKKRHKNSHILSAEEINAARHADDVSGGIFGSEPPRVRDSAMPPEQTVGGDTREIEPNELRHTLAEQLKAVSAEQDATRPSGFRVRLDDGQEVTPGVMPESVAPVTPVAPAAPVADEQPTMAFDLDEILSSSLGSAPRAAENKADARSTAAQGATIAFTPIGAESAPEPAPEPKRQLNIRRDYIEEESTAADSTPIADELFNEIGGVGTTFDKVRRRALHQPQIEAEPAKSVDELDDIIDDYRSIEDAESIRVDLKERAGKLSKRIFATAVLFVLTGVMTLLPSLELQLPSFISPLESTNNFLMINALLFALIFLVNFSTVLRGLFSLVRLHADIDTAVSISTVAAAAQLIYACANPVVVSEGAVFLYTSVAALSILFNLIGKRCMLARVRANFEFVATAGIKQSCFAAGDESSLVIANGSTIGQPVIACSKSVINLHNYLNNSFCEDPADSMCQVLAPVGLIAALLSGGISYYMTGNILSALTTAAAISAACVPLTSLLATNLPLFSASRRVREHGGMLSGYNAVEEFSDTECAVIDSEELFPAGTIDLLSLKAVGSMSVDEVIVDAASLCISAGGPLADVFDRMIEGRKKLLRPAENIFYDDGLGLSGMIGTRHIRMGNRSFMEQSSIHELPDIELETRIARNNCYAVYLASDNELCGMFVVKYTAPDEDACEQLRALCNAGVTLLIKTCDSNITPKLIKAVFGIPAEYVKVLPSYAVMEYDRISTPQENGDSVLAYDNTTEAFCAGVVAAKRLRLSVILATTIQTVGVILGFGAAMFFALTNDFLMILPHIIIAYQLLFACLTLFIPRLRRVV